MTELPQKFIKRMRERLGETFPAFLASYDFSPCKGLRVNTLKISEEEFLRRAPFPLLGSVGEGTHGYYIEEEKPGADPYHFAGLYYLQEPSAMTVGGMSEVLPKKRVLDLCAAPGGKTTHIAAQMAGEGVLIANEVNFGRAKILSQNVERMGIGNCAVISSSSMRPARARACSKKKRVPFPNGARKMSPDAPHGNAKFWIAPRTWCASAGIFSIPPARLPRKRTSGR